MSKKDEDFINKVNNNNFEYIENVKEFTGLIYHCPKCDEIFHLHIANVRLEKEEVINK